MAGLPIPGQTRTRAAVTVDGWPEFVVDITPLRKYRHFRRLWAGQVVSGIGSQLTLVAVSFQAYALTHSTLVVGLIGLAQLVPLLAGALWGGTLADAMDRRKVLCSTQVAMALAVGGLVINASLDPPGGVAAVRLHGGRRRVSGGGLAGPPGGAAHAGRRGRRDVGHRPADLHPAAGPGGRTGAWPEC